MRILILAAALLLTSFAPHAVAAKTVTLDLDASGADYKDCSVTVADGANAGDVLDAAVASGCILLWTYDSFPGYGRYVVCIDALCGVGALYWAFYVNGEYMGCGIDTCAISNGDVVRFDLTCWACVI